MPITHTDEVFDTDGNVIESTERTVPAPVVTGPDMQQAKQTLRTMWQTFMENGQPTGTPTNAQLRNWNLALTAAVRYLANEMDDEL
jgi:hypothetical protein